MIPNCVHARDRRYVEIRRVGDVLEDHRAQLRLVAVDEILALIVQYGLHRMHQRVVALLDRRNEPFGRVDLVLDELDRLAVGLGTLPAPGGHLADHLDVAPVDFDVGDVRRCRSDSRA